MSETKPVVDKSSRTLLGLAVEIPLSHVTILCPSVVWLTRDSDDESGVLSDVVEIWPARPERSPTPDTARGAVWLPAEHLDDRPYALPVCRLPLAAARRVFGTVPETDRECVRWGRIVSVFAGGVL